MRCRVYGKSDEDLSAENMLKELVKDKEVAYFVLHQRKPIDARPCQLPGSLLVQAVLRNGTVVSVQQARRGQIPRQL